MKKTNKTEIRMAVMLFTTLMVTSAFVGLAIGIASASGPTYVSGIISSDTTWTATDSPHIVVGNITVLPNVNLTLEAGTIVKFDGYFQIRMTGSALNVNGSEDNIVAFTSNQGSPTVGDWNTIFFDSGSTGIITYAVIEYATKGISTSDTSPTILNSELGNNSYGIYISETDSSPTIQGCTISTNEYGIYGSWAGWGADIIVSKCIILDNSGSGVVNDVSCFTIKNCTIFNNTIAGIQSANGNGNAIDYNTIMSNGIGVHVGAGHSTITYNTILSNDIGIKLGIYPIRNAINFNNLHDNIQYDVEYVGGHDDGRVDAEYNWWGTTNTDLIGHGIYDIFDDPGLGGWVDYEPILTEPVTPENIPPVASFTYYPLNPIVGQMITFDASASYDLDGSIVSYEWEFGDWSSATGEIVTHSYSSSGDYIVNLTVTDDYGATGSTSKTITVAPPAAPTISITTDEFEYSTGDPMTITIDITNPTEDSVTFQWYWIVPQFSIWNTVMSVPLPAGYDDTVDLSFTIPNWGSTPFGNVFYVHLLNKSGEVLDADAACWAYSTGGKAMPQVDIAEQIKKTIERVELPS